MNTIESKRGTGIPMVKDGEEFACPACGLRRKLPDVADYWCICEKRVIRSAPKFCRTIEFTSSFSKDELKLLFGILRAGEEEANYQLTHGKVPTWAGEYEHSRWEGEKERLRAELALRERLRSELAAADTESCRKAYEEWLAEWGWKPTDAPVQSPSG